MTTSSTRSMLSRRSAMASVGAIWAASTLGLTAVLLAVLVASGGGLRAQAPTTHREPRHVVIISVDGLKPETYTKPGPSKVPTLRRLARQGAWAEGVVGVLPTVTYPSHTTMITGVPPAVHGIPNNLILDPEGRANGEWYRFARDIQVPTLPGVVKGRGLTTAAVSWPVSAGMNVDYLLPEFGYYRHPQMLALMRLITEPRHLIDAYEVASGTPLPWPMSDDDRTGMAAWIFRTYRPHLLLLHIFGTDDAQHATGPGSAEALAAIERADRHVQQMLDAVRDAGLEPRTDIVIVSDHGFLPYEQVLQPNALFKQEGLLQVDAADRISQWQVYFYTAGGSGFVLLKDPRDSGLRDRVAGLLKTLAEDPATGIDAVLDRTALDRLGAEPRASFAITMKSGFATGGAHDVLVRATGRRQGTHGYAPAQTELHASLILRGPDVPKVGSLGMVRMTQLAPTVAGWFGVSLAPNVDAPLALGGR